MKHRQYVCTAVLAFGMATAASAQEWSWTPALYGWLAGLDGKSGVGTTISEIDQSFSDILENLDFAAMLSVDGNNNDKDNFLYDTATSGLTVGVRVAL